MLSTYLMMAVSGVSVGLHAPKSTIESVLSSEYFPPASKADASQELVFSWANTDFNSAAKWVNDRPDEVIRDRAVVGLLNSISNQRLELPETRQLINSISDGQIRENTIKTYPHLFEESH